MSPFRVKGALYLGTQSYFAKQPCGIAGVCAALGDPPLVAFLTQRFLPGSFYEVMHVPALIDAEARALGTTVDAYLLDRSRFQAGLDTSGVYSLLLRLTNPDAVLERLPRLVTQMFNFGEGRTLEIGKRSRRLVLEGIPRALEPWLSVAIHIYVETTVMRAGASECTVTPLEVESRPPHESYPMCAIGAEISWR